jgi:uncharacterized membrane protein
MINANIWQLMKSADHSQMQQQAKKQDESKWVIMLIVLLDLTLQNCRKGVVTVELE